MPIFHKMNRSTGILKVMVVSLMFAFALGSFYAPLTVAPVQAAGEDGASKHDEKSETTGASREAKDKLDGFTDGIKSFFNGIKNWFGEKFKSMNDSIYGMFGGEVDEGMGTFFGSLVWGVIGIAFLFLVALAYNMVKGIFGGGESSVSERYRK